MSGHQRINGPLGSKIISKVNTIGSHQQSTMEPSSVNQFTRDSTRNAKNTALQSQYQAKGLYATKPLSSMPSQNPDKPQAEVLSQVPGLRPKTSRLEQKQDTTEGAPKSSEVSGIYESRHGMDPGRKRLSRKPPTSTSVYTRSSDVTQTGVERNPSDFRASDIVKLDNEIRQMVLDGDMCCRTPSLDTPPLEHLSTQELPARSGHLRGHQESQSSFNCSDKENLSTTSKEFTRLRSSGTSFKSNHSGYQTQMEDIEVQQHFAPEAPLKMFYDSNTYFDSHDNEELSSNVAVDCGINGKNTIREHSLHKNNSASLEDLGTDFFSNQSRSTHDSGVPTPYKAENRNESFSSEQSVVAGHDKLSPISSGTASFKVGQTHVSHSSRDFSYPSGSSTIISEQQTTSDVQSSTGTGSESASNWKITDTAHQFTGQLSEELKEPGESSHPSIPRKTSSLSESSRPALQYKKRDGVHNRMSSVSSVNSACSNHHVSLATLKMALILRPGEGEKSYYVDVMRKNSGTSFNEAGPGKWKLPTGIMPIDKREYLFQSNKKFTRGTNGAGYKTKKSSGVELKHGHLQPRLLAAEVDEGEITNKYGALGRSSTLQNKPLTPTTSKSPTPPTVIDGISRANSLERGTTCASISTTGDMQSSLSKASDSRRGSDSSFADSVGSIKGEQRVDIYYQHQGFRIESNDDSSEYEESTNRFEENSYDDSEEEKPRLFLANPDSDSS